MGVQCPGCGTVVHARGLRNHILKSSDPRCQAADEIPLNVDIDDGSQDNIPQTRIHHIPTPANTLPNQPPDTSPPPTPVSQHPSPSEFPPSNHSDCVFNIDRDLFGDHGILFDTTFTGQAEEGEGREDEEEEDSDKEGSEGSDHESESLDSDWEDEWVAAVEAENGLEPERSLQVEDEHMAMNDEPTQTTTPLRMRGGAEEGLKLQPFVVQYRKAAQDRWKESQPGAEFHQDQHTNRQDNLYAPFGSKLEWEIARWAKLRGPSSTAFTELMAIDGVAERLGLSFRTTAQLNKIIDKHLTGRPAFKRKEVPVGGEVCELYYRDIIPCIKALFGDPNFAPYLVFSPSKQYTNQEQTCRAAVEREKPGATIIPVNLSTDKTLLTLFRNKQAYPLYLTIGNIPKEIRRKVSAHAYVLLAYLPVTKLENVTNKASRRRQLNNLYHACMSFILRPLRSAGTEGLNMTTGAGYAFRTHPIVATFNGDYPEQLLVTGVKQLECVTCEVEPEELGEFGDPKPLRDLERVLEVLDSFDEDPAQFLKTCSAAGIKPIPSPFWKDLPYVHIFQAVTPDILHQLHQGIFKHLVSWVISVYGPLEIDARCRRLPPNHNIRLFMKGISSLSRVTGQEHDQMSRILLGLIIGIKIPGGFSPVRLVRAVRGLLDFLYLAQYPIHTDETLALTTEALQAFHDNKSVFIDLGIREHFNIPKLHFATHWVEKIKLFGTADNTDTQHTERLHIDLAKDAYAATNHKDEFSQMTVWLERQEKIYKHEQYIQWRLDGEQLPPVFAWIPPGLELDRVRHLSKHPSTRKATLDKLVSDYGAVHFRMALARFVSRLNDPDQSSADLERSLWDVRLPLQKYMVWHRVKFRRTDRYTGIESTVDSVHCHPARSDKYQHPVPARFDTALINLGGGKDTGLDGYHIGRVRVIFSLPERVHHIMFRPGVTVPSHLAYIEWFSPFEDEPDPNHGLYKIKTTRNREGHLSSVVPVANIRRSAHLYPDFGPVAPVEWKSSTVLDLCDIFYLNSFSDKVLYRIVT